MRMYSRISLARPRLEPSSALQALRKGQKPRGKVKQGLKFEALALEYLEGIMGEKMMFFPQQWFHYQSGLDGDDQWHWCQLDAFAVDVEMGKITIFEIKLKHTEKAYFQLKHLYLPVLQAIFNPEYWAFQLCEVVRFYDPFTPFPAAPVLCIDPYSIPDRCIGVHICNPK